MSTTEGADIFSGGALTISQATREFGIGRTKIYELMRSGALPYSDAVGRRLIPRAAVVKLLAAGMALSGSARCE